MRNKKNNENEVPQVIKNYDECSHCEELKMRKINWMKTKDGRRKKPADLFGRRAVFH